MKKTGLFFFLLGAFVLGGCQKNVDVSQIDTKDSKYHLETIDYTSGEDISSPEEIIQVEGKNFRLVSSSDEELEKIKGYDTETFEEEYTNVIPEKVIVPETKEIDGKKYDLDDVVISDSGERKTQLTKIVNYTDVQPESIIIDTYFDEESESTIEVTYHLTDFNEVNSWTDDLQIPLTVYDYDAYVYMINGALVTANDDSIDISGAENEILAYANMNPSNYRIYGAYWSSGVYQNGDTLSRDAIAYGSRIQTNTEANYIADVELPKLSNIKAIYTCKIENPEKDIIKMRKTLFYQKDNAMTQVAIAVTVGVFVAIIFILLLIFKLKKGEKRNV